MRVPLKQNLIILIPSSADEASELDTWKSNHEGHVYISRETKAWLATCLCPAVVQVSWPRLGYAETLAHTICDCSNLLPRACWCKRV